MTHVSFSDVFSINLDREHDEHIRVGDVVRTGLSHFPYFEVIAVSGDKAWLRDLQTATDHLAPLIRCRKVEDPAIARAAA